MIASAQQQKNAGAIFARAQQKEYLPEDATLTFWFERIFGWVARVCWRHAGEQHGIECGGKSLPAAVSESVEMAHLYIKAQT